MKKFFTLLCCSFLCGKAISQQLELKVNMINDTKNAAPVGTAVLSSSADSAKRISKTISDQQVFAVNAHTSYLLEITASGFEPIRETVEIGESPVTISLHWKNKTTNLADVVVVAKKPLLLQQDDKTIVDAEQLAAASTNAYEILEKTPGIIVDQDGNAYLNSTTPATIQINGREVKLSAADLASLLKSLPANSIVKVEILRTPSAKYDAASSGGIINIVLKKGVKLGTNGTVNAGFFQGKYNTGFVGFNINKGTGKLNTSLSYNYTDRDNFEEINSSRLSKTDSSSIIQHSYTRYPGQNHFTKLGLDAELNKNLTIGYDGRFSFNNGNSRAANDIDIVSQQSGTLLGQNRSDITNKSNSFFASNDIYSKLKIDSLGSEWESEISFDFFRNKNAQAYNNRFLLPAQPSVLGNGDLDNDKNIITAETDLTLKLKKGYTLETGGRFVHSNSRNNSFYYLNDNGVDKVDSFQTNQFKYNEQIGSLYAQIAKTFAGFTIKPGLRMEYTHIKGTQLFPRDTSFGINRTDFFPYIYLSHDLFKMMGFTLKGNLVYRKSISRPYYEALNPYPKYVDQYLFEVGNPRLAPQFTTTYEFNVQADGFPIFSVGINDIKDIISNVTYQDDSTKIVYRTFDNLGKNTETYFRVMGGIPPGRGKYFFYIGGQYNHSNYEGFYANQPLSYKRGTWTFFTYHNFKPSPVWNFSLNGFMRLKGLQNFYEINSVGQLNFSVNRSLLNKKMNVILSFNDMFYSNKYNFKIDQPTIVASGERFTDTRRVGLTVRYNFGIKPKEDKQDVQFGSSTEGSN
ncbi:MAG: outer membrane beta-barrel protein [Ferruginibacter sp.]